MTSYEISELCPTLLQPHRLYIACQTPLSMEFSRLENCSGVPFPSPEDVANPGIEPVSLELAGRFFTTGRKQWLLWKTLWSFLK